jgi:NADH oxidase (H2O2-forming)
VWEKPDVPGANLEGLHYVKDIRAAMEFDKQLDGMKRVVVIGATPLGVEMAGNLGHRGLRGATSSTRARGCCRGARPDVAEPVHESLEKRGVTLRLGTRSRASSATAACAPCRPRAGELECDAVIVLPAQAAVPQAG